MARESLRSQVEFAMVPVWVLQRCSSRAVHVYGLLMRYANQRTRRAWPKTQSLADALGLSLRTTERAIAELRKKGAIETSRRHGSNGAVLGLEFVIIAVDPGADHSATSGGKATDHPATGVAAIPPPVAGYKSNQIQENQIQEQEERKTPPAVSLPILNPNDPVDALACEWNTLTESPPFRHVATLTAKRRRWIRAALAERPREVWRGVIFRVNQSSFCRGEKGWVASFDWLVKTTDSAVKVLEGQYDDRVSETDLAAVRQWRARTGNFRTCVHGGDGLPCLNLDDCDQRLAREFRQRKVAS